eukprot:CAMPEP_0175996284 /NCGR_PEP_ID=MMETSP0108-20121206/55583_1 /TAXON_ID=195067 ORGANISM="Goniomonas pacifica, Strain CCMP1869" /NCGR_SAMPLE_ID=MMETSP0108 /ASSEMBLY_ACC=CAM_ASM_000204 /LENGTH=240 /DNA_ID=CAMNT_0017328463 /DNA_START=1 /DNA_END=723 /DNA_ORIENTATION=+
MVFERLFSWLGISPGPECERPTSPEDAPSFDEKLLHWRDVGTARGTKKDPLHFKAIMLGHPSVGKTCFIDRLTRDQFQEYPHCTIGSCFQTRELTSSSGHSVKIDVWDQAGSERFRSLTPLFYRGAHGCFLVFSVTDRDSFNARSLRQSCDDLLRFQPGTVILLVGNKYDLTEERQVSYADAQDFADEMGLRYVETSCKTSTESVIEATKVLVDDCVTFATEGVAPTPSTNALTKSATRY